MVYKNLERRDKIGDNQNKINIITSDGNWEYHGQIKCNKRTNVKVNKEKIKDSKGKETSKEKMIRIDIKTGKKINFLEFYEEFEKEKHTGKKKSDIWKYIKEENQKLLANSEISKTIKISNFKRTKSVDINNLHCEHHIIDKAETCLVESYNGSLRGCIAKFIRKTKSFSKSFDSLKDAVLMWVNRGLLIENRRKYAR